MEPEEMIQKLVLGMRAVEALINDSEGVTGLHLNGNDAPWESLRTGGEYEMWLEEFDEALGIIEEYL